MTHGTAPSAASARPEWLRRKERGSVPVMKLMVGLALFLGRPAVRFLLPAICGYFLAFSPRSNRASALYLTRALGRSATPVDIYRHYRAFASCVLDRVFLLKNRTEMFELRVHGDKVLTDALAQGGCILLGAHIGSFEVLRALGRAQPNLKIKMVMYDDNARKITAVLNAIDPALANDIINLGQPSSFIAIQECLERGEIVGVLADRSLTEEGCIAVPFLGAPARFSPSAFRMIAILQRPVVLMVGLYRGGRRYDIHIESFAASGEIPRRTSPGEVEDLLRRYVRRLEFFCRLAPYNWFNFYDAWRS